MNNPWEAVKALFKTQKQKDAGRPEGVWHHTHDKQLQEQQAERYTKAPTTDPSAPIKVSWDEVQQAGELMRSSAVKDCDPIWKGDTNG